MQAAVAVRWQVRIFAFELQLQRLETRIHETRVFVSPIFISPVIVMPLPAKLGNREVASAGTAGTSVIFVCRVANSNEVLI